MTEHRNLPALPADTARAVSTPEGERALRLIVCSASWGETDIAEARRLLSPAVVAALPAARRQLEARLAPALGRDFKRHVSPTLALVAPVGMSEDDQTAWLAVAAETLSGIPADLLEYACARVRRKADHPSKIVAGIFAEVGRAWDDRRADWRKLEQMEALTGTPSAPVYVSPQDAAEIIDAAGLRRAKPKAPRPLGPPRMPSADEVRSICRETIDAIRTISANALEVQEEADRREQIAEMAAEEEDAPLDYGRPPRAKRAKAA